MSQPIATPASNAAPTAAPAPAAAPATPAPVAAAPAPTTLNEFAERARKSLAGELPATPETAPADPGPEPSPEPSLTDPAQPDPNAPPTDPGEPTPEDVSAWTEGEKKLHGALQKERTESKEARAEVRELRAKLAELESKIITPNPAKPAEPATPAPPNIPLPSTGGLLADCTTFEAVDARVEQAAATESEVMRLQNVLTRNGVEPVLAKLKASGVAQISGVPVDEASADQVGEFLASAYTGARMTQAQASGRKTWLANNQQSLAAAVKILPDLLDQNSEAYRSGVKLVQENPNIRQRPDWPLLVAKLYLGERDFNARSQAPPAAPAVAPAQPSARPAASKPAPGAPRKSVAAMPQVSNRAAIQTKIAAGTATLAEVQEYARGYVTA